MFSQYPHAFTEINVVAEFHRLWYRKSKPQEETVTKLRPRLLSRILHSLNFRPAPALVGLNEDVCSSVETC